MAAGDNVDLRPRVRAFLENILKAQGGAIGPFRFGNGPWFDEDGGCAICGELVEDGGWGRCRKCAQAIRLAMAAYDQGESL